MASILAFAGSNSSTSINYQLVRHTISLIKDHDLELLDLVNYPLPMYSEDFERNEGFPNLAQEIHAKIKKADALVISVNEHNGGPSAYFKNLLDWLSRIDRNYMENTKVFLMSTSPGKRGAIGSHAYVEGALPRVGAQVVATFSLSSFNANFDMEQGITEETLNSVFQDSLKAFLAEI